MVSYKLTSFDNRGLAECIRLMFHYSGVEFEDNRISHAAWMKLKPHTQTGKLPFLEVDGKQLFESGAICRYLAPKLGLVAEDPWENAEMEAIVEAYADFHTDIKPYLVSAYGDPIKNKALYQELFIPASEKHFNRLTKIITTSESGFISNSGITWGDFFLAENLATMKQVDPHFEERFPKMVEYERKIHGLSQLQSYLTKRKISTA